MQRSITPKDKFTRKQATAQAERLQRALFTTEFYRQVKRHAEAMLPAMCGDLRYEDPEINLVGFVERITGWILAQRTYSEFAMANSYLSPRDEPEMMARDIAEQVASDLTRGNPCFA